MYGNLTPEGLEASISFPSFEEELAASDILKHANKDKSARIMRCPICGSTTVVGPQAAYRCPKAPHDSEDEVIDGPCEVMYEESDI